MAQQSEEKQPKAGKKAAFNLKAGDSLPAEEAPAIANQQFKVEARVDGLPRRRRDRRAGGKQPRLEPLREGRPAHFATKLHHLATTLPAGEQHVLKVTVAKDKLSLAAGNTILATLEIDARIPESPHRRTPGRPRRRRPGRPLRSRKRVRRNGRGRQDPGSEK